MLLRSLRYLVRRPARVGALLSLTLPVALQGIQETTSERWDRVFRRVESTQIHSDATFPVYCVQRLLREEKLEPGDTVLMIAMGDGRNAVPIAELGLAVTGLDISPVALEKAHQAAQQHGVQLNGVLADMYEHDLGDGRWDLVTNIYYNPAIRIIDRLKAAVRPGGFLLVEGFGSDHEQGPPAWSRYRPNQLLDELNGWRILEYQDGLFESDWARGELAPVVRVLAQKPGAPEEADRSR
jgi:SAM-dependent methyltransferase